MAAKKKETLGVAGPAKRSCQDRHRQSGFESKWSQDFPFMVYSHDSGGMFCTLCWKWKKQTRSRNGVWVSLPCTTLQRDSILEHVRSGTHEDAVKAEREFVHACLRGGIAQSIDKVQSTQKDGLVL